MYFTGASGFMIWVLMAKHTKNAATYGGNFAATAIIDCLLTSHTDTCRTKVKQHRENV
jgi:hypothetical protein